MGTHVEHRPGRFIERRSENKVWELIHKTYIHHTKTRHGSPFIDDSKS